MRPASPMSKGSASTAPPASHDLLGGGVGVVDPDVGVPRRHRRRALGHRRDGPDVAASDAPDQVAAVGALGHRLLELPPEEPAVEPAALAGSGWLVSTQQGTPGMKPSRSGMSSLRWFGIGWPRRACARNVVTLWALL